MAFNMFKKKKKQDFKIEVAMICDFHGYEGKEIVIKWKRGKKDGNSGKFPPIKILGGKRQEIFGVQLELHCTLFEKQKRGFYEEKLILFTFETAKGKKICSGVLDLAQFADLDGRKEETIIELGAKGKQPKAQLVISIISTEGVSTGYSENTENLIMDSSDDGYYRSGAPKTQIDLHSSLMIQMKNRESQKEEQEEEMLRKKQMMERDAMMKNEEPEFLGDFLGDMPPVAARPGRGRQEKNDEDQLDSLSSEDSTEAEGKRKSTKKRLQMSEVSFFKQNNAPVKEEEESESTEEEENLEDQVEKVKEIFDNEFVNNDRMADMLHNYKNEKAVRCIIGKYVEENTIELIPLLNESLFGNRNMFIQSPRDLEEMNAKKIMRKLGEIHEYLGEKNVDEDLIEKVLKQTYHFLGYYVLDTLLKTPEKICCTRGFQFKYFMSRMEIMSSQREFKPLIKNFKELDVINDIANVLMLHHVIAVNDVETTFPTLSINVIYQLLVNFHTDEMDPDPVSPSYLRSISNKCTEEPIPTRFTFVI